MTQLEMVNKILLRLREDDVSTVAENDYSRLIGAFINDAKADLEDINHSWSAYETEIDVAILADGTRTYDLAATNDRSYLLRAGQPGYDQMPIAFDITTDEMVRLSDVPLKDVRTIRALNNDVQSVRPTVFALTANNEPDEGWAITLLWGADNARSWRMYWHVPQDDLTLNGSDDNTQIILPNRPIELRALAYAINEREIAQDPASQKAWARSSDSQASALELDMQVQKISDSIDFTNLEYL